MGIGYVMSRVEEFKCGCGKRLSSLSRKQLEANKVSHFQSKQHQKWINDSLGTTGEKAVKVNHNNEAT
jgi:hypothetical protein